MTADDSREPGKDAAKLVVDLLLKLETWSSEMRAMVDSLEQSVKLINLALLRPDGKA